MAEPRPIPLERIERAILVLRGHRVILDKDLAALYGVTTGNLNHRGFIPRRLPRPPDPVVSWRHE